MTDTPPHLRSRFAEALSVVEVALARDAVAAHEYAYACHLLRQAQALPDGREQDLLADAAARAMTVATMRLVAAPAVRQFWTPGALHSQLTLAALAWARGQPPSPDTVGSLPRALQLRVRRLWPGQQTTARWLDGRLFLSADAPEEHRRLATYLKWYAAYRRGERARWAGRRDGPYWTRERLIDGLRQARAAWQSIARLRRPKITQAWVADVLNLDRSELSRRLSEEHISWMATKRWIAGQAEEPW